MTVFGLFIFLMMLMVAGMAVDLARHETNRARLQATLDRAILAAADLDQREGPQAVVEDHFRAAGLRDQLTNVEVTGAINSRTVSADAAIELDTFFMDLVGVETLEAPAGGTAEESVNDIEIVLVLDVSGSMVANGSPRLANLQAAARDFVQTVLEDDDEGRISIALVPFNGQVNLGAALRGKYAVADRVDTLYSVNNVNCVDLPASAYETQTISRSTSMPATAWADTFSTTNRTNGYVGYTDGTSGVPNANNRWCPATAGNVVRLPSHDIATLQGQISGLVGIGATSINAGMRWGMTMLDPGARPMFGELGIHATFPGRPYDYGREDTLKIIVLMTDGSHYPEERVNADYRSGSSPIYRAPSDGNLSIRHSTGHPVGKPFWVPHRGEWHWRAWNGALPSATPPAECANDNDSTGDPDGKGACNRVPSGATQQTWPQVWTMARMHWVAWQLYGRALGTNGTTRTAIADARMNAFRTTTGTRNGSTIVETDAMDDQLQRMCDRARESNVVVYGIAFEAPPLGQAAIERCASSPSHYYNAQGLEIGTVFRSIAGNIDALRLVH